VKNYHISAASSMIIYYGGSTAKVSLLGGIFQVLKYLER